MNRFDLLPLPWKRTLTGALISVVLVAGGSFLIWNRLVSAPGAMITSASLVVVGVALSFGCVSRRALERRIKEADEANRLKDEFLATLSHELRTPLNAILGWAQILRRGGLDGDAADRALETISRNALAQGRIIADILDMQAIAAGSLRLTLQPVDLASVARRAIDAVNPAARLKAVEILDFMDEDVGLVLGDSGRLEQILGNLLSNAVKFSPRGGRVRIRLRKAGAHAEFVVADSGPGLDPAFIPFAFDRFRQGDSSSTRRQGGLGLGLAIVRDLVELHGGSAAVTNREGGGGASFNVRLPLLRGRAVREPRTQEGPYPEIDRPLSLAQAPQLHGVRVLVVDNEPDSRESTTEALTLCGAVVTSAGSAEEGFAALKRSRPHVVLSDIEMPDEDGYALVRRIRSLPAEEGGSTPAAAFTAYAGREDRARALGAGFQVHVPKPAQPAELVAVVSSLARGAEADRPQTQRMAR